MYCSLYMHITHCKLSIKTFDPFSTLNIHLDVPCTGCSMHLTIFDTVREYCDFKVDN